MEHWEFLIQKEGDRSWLPLESPNVEILEGRYRIVARSSRVNTPVDIRICHQAFTEVPPRRRVQKRSNRTNQEGLMVVIPFTSLKPGLWELSCGGDLMSDLMGNSWKYTVQLQVISHDAEVEDWDARWQDPSPEHPETSLVEGDSSEFTHASPAQTSQESSPEPPGSPSPPMEQQPSLPFDPDVSLALGTSMERFMEAAEQMSRHLVDQAFQDVEGDVEGEDDRPAAPLDLPSVTTDLSIPTGLEWTTEAGVPGMMASMTFPLGITLEQEAYVAHRGKAMTLKGQVDYLNAQVVPNGENPPIAATELHIYLRDPQTNQVLINLQQSLPSQTPPLVFACSVTVPATLETRLLLGEVVLCEGATVQTEDPLALATQAFIVTANPEDLLDEVTRLSQALAEHEEAENPLDPSGNVEEQLARTKLESSYLKLSFLGTEDVSEAAAAPARFPSLAGQPLPPQLYRPEPTEIGQKALDLPSFGSPLKSAPQPTPKPEAADLEEPDLSFLEMALVEEGTIALPTPEDPHPTDNGISEESAPSFLSEDAPTVEAEAIVTEQTPDIPDFQALRLQDRFWARLNSLATDAELSEWLKLNLPNSPVRKPLINTSLVGGDADLASREFVVDDTPLPRKKPRPADLKARKTVEEPAAIALGEEDPVPTPSLEVQGGELTTGKPVNVRIRIPKCASRIYVKLWVNDCQTRSLLDGPRWLVDFLPDPEGMLETNLQLTIPEGSLEIRFEAIALEMQTQRESHKVSVTRQVVPPGLPELSLDEFGVF